MRTKSILTEARQIDRAVTLIRLGARLQVLESETDLSYERLLRLYNEVAGKSPSNCSNCAACAAKAAARCR